MLLQQYVPRHRCAAALLFARFSVHIFSVPSQILDPSFSIEDALVCLANEAHLALLDGHTTGGSYLCWGTPPTYCQQLSELQVSTGSAQPSNASWPHSVDGGALVQIDYEFPVGTWAASSAQPGQAKLWPLKTWLHWRTGKQTGEQTDEQTDGQHNRCTLHAETDADLRRALAQLRSTGQQPALQYALPSQLSAAWNFADYQQRIEQIQMAIRSGDVYQINLTMPFRCAIAQRKHLDTALYCALRAQSPAPYSAFFRDHDHCVLSHSPERFLSAHHGRCSSHPIKGTRKRIVGRDSEQRADLLAAEKDRAELAMIIDLVRNDLGRIAERGSVQVDQQRHLMDLPYVHHAVGHVSCKLKPATRLADMLAACFPPGSITGAPKIRAMQIIQDLEAQVRGAYCGCFGWIGADANCELAVAIRCLQMDSQQLRIDAGGGIVIDSQADSEWHELNDKASAMQAALKGFLCTP